MADRLQLLEARVQAQGRLIRYVAAGALVLGLVAGSVLGYLDYRRGVSDDRNRKQAHAICALADLVPPSAMTPQIMQLRVAFDCGPAPH